MYLNNVINNRYNNVVTFGNTSQPSKSVNIPWVRDPVLSKALEEISSVTFNEKDYNYVKSIGMSPQFSSGKEAVNFIRNNRVSVEFVDFEDNEIHGAYDPNTNAIQINGLYRNTKNPQEITAIASTILHEAGHAKDRFNTTTLQEELNCLSLNALSHRAYKRKNPELYKNCDSFLIQEGVGVYEKLFFDPDPSKKNLINRMKEKYYDLPLHGGAYRPSEIAVKSYVGTQY